MVFVPNRITSHTYSSIFFVFLFVLSLIQVLTSVLPENNGPVFLHLQGHPVEAFGTKSVCVLCHVAMLLACLLKEHTFFV